MGVVSNSFVILFATNLPGEFMVFQHESYLMKSAVLFLNSLPS